MIWGAVGALAISMSLVILHRLIAPTWSLFEPLMFILVMGPLIAALIALVLGRPSSLQAALRIEERSRLHERLSSIVFFGNEATDCAAVRALLVDGEIWRHRGSYPP